MTYAPLWPGWDTTTREVITQLNAELDHDTREVVRELAEYLGSHLRGEFADVDPQIVGWVTMRVASHLGAMSAKRPDVDPRTFATIALLAGEYIEAGDV